MTELESRLLAKANAQQAIPTITEANIAKQVIDKAYKAGKIDRTAILKGHLFLDRAINLQKYADTAVATGTRISREAIINDNLYF